jgi:hypothetical protein
MSQGMQGGRRTIMWGADGGHSSRDVVGYSGGGVVGREVLQHHVRNRADVHTHKTSFEGVKTGLLDGMRDNSADIAI